MSDLLPGVRVLLTGAHGMLAGHLIPLLQRSGADLVLASLAEARPTIPAGASDIPSAAYPAHPIEDCTGDIHELDITDPEDCSALVRDLRPNWIVNAAAYTAVDHAQRDYSRAFEINAMGPKNLAHAARISGARLVHISSDYVFGGSPFHSSGTHTRTEAGSGRTPYTEESPHAPCGLYGESKRFGDELVLAESHLSALVLRTSWLHGLYGGNFVDTILTRSAELPELRVVADQFGNPTWADLLAHTAVELMARDASGVFHVSSRGGISWHEFAAEIVRVAKRACLVREQTSEELNRPAPRPAYSVLSVEKVESTLQRPMPSWKAGLAEHLKARGYPPITESSK